VGLGSTRKVIKLGETFTNTSYTPPSPIKATPTSIAGNSDDVSTASVSKAGDVMMTSSSQKSKLLKKNSITPNKDPPEGRTTAIVTVMRGTPKHSHPRQRSNKHYKQKLVRVLLGSGSGSDLDDAMDDRGRRHCRHLREGGTMTTGGGCMQSSGWAAGVVRRPLMPSSEIHRGADGMDRARHGRPPAAMAMKTKTMMEDRIVSPGTYHLLPPNNSTKPSAGGITNKP
jgi:hypothetical protein